MKPFHSSITLLLVAAFLFDAGFARAALRPAARAAPVDFGAAFARQTVPPTRIHYTRLDYVPALTASFFRLFWRRKAGLSSSGKRWGAALASLLLPQVLLGSDAASVQPGPQVLLVILVGAVGYLGLGWFLRYSDRLMSSSEREPTFRDQYRRGAQRLLDEKDQTSWRWTLGVLAEAARRGEQIALNRWERTRLPEVLKASEHDKIAEIQILSAVIKDFHGILQRDKDNWHTLARLQQPFVRLPLLLKGVPWLARVR